MSNDEMLVEILKIVNDLKDDVKENRREIQKSREIEEAHWQENLRRWNENDKKWEENKRRWDENDKRWQENEKRWEENERRWQANEKRWEANEKCWEINEKRWEKYEINRKADRKFLIDTLISYDISISQQLGDPNVEKMRKIV